MKYSSEYKTKALILKPAANTNMPRTVKLCYWENLVSVVSHRKRQYISSETIEGRWILWTLTEPVARVSSKDADVCVHTNLLTDMTRYADQYSRIQCLYRHPGRDQQHSHTCEHERPNLILFSPDWDGDSLVAHTQISSIHRHTHICTFLDITFALRLPNTHHQILCSVFALVLGWVLHLCACGSPSTHWQVQLRLWIIYPPNTESTK